MKLSTETKELVKKVIRDAIVLDPMISLRNLQALLKKKGVNIGNLNYLGKLRKEITADAVFEVDRTKVVERFAELDERCRVMRNQLFQIVFARDNPVPGERLPTASEQIAAISTITKMDVMLLKTAIDIGLYKKKTLPGKRYTAEEELAMRNKPLPPEAKEMIKRAMQNWGLIDKDGNPIFKEKNVKLDTV